MKAPQGKYFTEIVRKEGTADNLTKVMFEAQENNCPFFIYEINEKDFVLFRTPGVPVSEEDRKLVIEAYLGNKNIEDGSAINLNKKKWLLDRVMKNIARIFSL